MEISRLNQSTPIVVQTSQTSSDSTGGDSNIAANANSVGTAAVNNQNTELSNSKSVSEKPVDKKELDKAIERLNKFLETDNVSVEYSIHPQFKDIMIKIVDKETGNTITEVPPKKILDMVAKMCQLAGIIFDKKA